jgi:hypothetical protein
MIDGAGRGLGPPLNTASRASARWCASTCQCAGALGEEPDAARRNDRDLSSRKSARVAAADRRVPWQEALHHLRLKRQLCNEAVVRRPVVTHVAHLPSPMGHLSDTRKIAGQRLGL